MLRNDKNLSETDIRTEGSELAFLVASLADKRPWLKTGTLCKSLERHKMLHLGVAKMVPPFEIVRMKLGGTYFLAGLGGEGRVIVDGRWKTCSPGQAFLLPPGTLHAFEAMPRQDWEFCWIRFQEDLPGQPIADANSPVLASFDGRPLRHAILGLHEEAKGPARGEMEARWLDLIFRHIQIFAGPPISSTPASNNFSRKSGKRSAKPGKTKRWPQRHALANASSNASASANWAAPRANTSSGYACTALPPCLHKANSKSRPSPTRSAIPTPLSSPAPSNAAWDGHLRSTQGG